ncbi:hypothetical protein DXT99_03435 [Pontibacter diazotrophicus]|uniref:Uncharacterized protein n=1 Tax=Pontibacter diazotrophicus TaxID=1400979 RepID=A0A3D8LHX9_9BACT|nr:hypothetical protein [Pontibacter diazotrophicus]RDV16844.1 hypothetical protein DXT99_03435 [Pontibacter diazotrophicus]
MEKILFGDNQFFAINHISDEKSRAQSIKFKDDKSIIKTLDYAMEANINTFMCTTHDRISKICDSIRENPIKYQNFKIYPCLPYAHKYANAVTELGLTNSLKQFVPGNFMGSMFKGGLAFLGKDYIAIMELLIDAELKIFEKIDTPVIFLQNVVTDLLLGLGMDEILLAFHNYIATKYGVEAGFITMNMPKLLDTLERVGIKNPIICSSINKLGFRMAGGRACYEDVLNEKQFRAIAMQVLAAGAIPPQEAIEYVCSLPNIQSILFGASSKANIIQTTTLIHQFHETNEVFQNVNKKNTESSKVVLTS